MSQENVPIMIPATVLEAAGLVKEEKRVDRPDWLAISDPNAEVKMGDYCTGNEEATYHLGGGFKGNLFCRITKNIKGDAKHTFRVYGIDDMGRLRGPYRVTNNAMNKIPREQIVKAIEAIKSVQDEKVNKVHVGEYLELSRDVLVPNRGDYSCGTFTIPGGTEVIADTEVMRPLPGSKFGEFDAADFVLPSVKCYIPLLDTIMPLSVRDLKPYESRMGNAKPVLPDGHWDRIRALTRRVLEPDAHKFVYEQLGLKKMCYKGKGLIVLLYGPPGTGKTMTAEYMADSLKKPLIRLQLGGLFDADAVRDKLVRGFELAAKYKAVLLLDEVDVFIRKRGGSPVFDANTAEFLRTLEHYEGILVMTTNLATHIDEAVFSRAHVVLGYEQQTPAERKIIWESLLTQQVRDSMIGNENTFNAMIGQLSEIKLNGREIKTVVQNAITRAFSLLVRPGEDFNKIPLGKAKWISPKNFIEEAEGLVDTRENLKGQGRPDVP